MPGSIMLICFLFILQEATETKADVRQKRHKTWCYLDIGGKWKDSLQNQGFAKGKSH